VISCQGSGACVAVEGVEQQIGTTTDSKGRSHWLHHAPFAETLHVGPRSVLDTSLDVLHDGSTGVYQALRSKTI
jgi:hypothetical protein